MEEEGALCDASSLIYLRDASGELPVPTMMVADIDVMNTKCRTQGECISVRVVSSRVDAVCGGDSLLFCAEALNLPRYQSQMRKREDWLGKPFNTENSAVDDLNSLEFRVLCIYII